MALSKRRKAEIKTAQKEVANHSELVRYMVEGKKIEITVEIRAKIIDPATPDNWRIADHDQANILSKTQNISDIRDPYILRQIRSWLNRKSGQRSRHIKNE